MLLIYPFYSIFKFGGGGILLLFSRPGGGGGIFEFRISFSYLLVFDSNLMDFFPPKDYLNSCNIVLKFSCVSCDNIYSFSFISSSVIDNFIDFLDGDNVGWIN